jgi:stage II sporulation protein M
LTDIKFSDFQKEPFRLEALAAKIKDYYRDEWTLFQDAYKKNLKFVCLIFVLSLALSYIYFDAHPDQASRAFMSLSKYYKKQSWLEDPPVVQCLAIFFINGKAALTAYLAGLVPFFVFPILGTAFTAGTLSLLAIAIHNMGESVIPAFLALVAPHGIVELPALLYSFTLGFYLSQQITAKVLKGRRKDVDDGSSELFGAYTGDSSASTKDLLIQVGATFGGVILPLLFLAAVIEVFVTPLVGRAFLR